MEAEFEKGLSKTTNAAAEIKMLPAYVTETPNGKGLEQFICVCISWKSF